MVGEEGYIFSFLSSDHTNATYQIWSKFSSSEDVNGRRSRHDDRRQPIAIIRNDKNLWTTVF